MNARRVANDRRRPRLPSSRAILLFLLGSLSASFVRRRQPCSGDGGELFARAKEDRRPSVAFSSRHHVIGERRRRRAQTSSSSSISGFGFFDDNDDGVGGVGDSAIPNASVWLFTCTNEIIKFTKTDDSGRYSFEGLLPSRYYVMIPTPPRGYVFTDVWNGATDDDGVLLYPNADSAVNPETGNTECFELAGGEERGASFGMVPDVPPTPPPTSAPSPSPITDAPVAPPTASPTGAAVVTSAPTASPTSGPIFIPPTLPPTGVPSSSPSDSPATSPPTASPSIAPATATVVTRPPRAPPTTSPTSRPTSSPSSSPITRAPTTEPTGRPAEEPSNHPTPSFPNEANGNYCGATPDGASCRRPCPTGSPAECGVDGETCFVGTTCAVPNTPVPTKMPVETLDPIGPAPPSSPSPTTLPGPPDTQSPFGVGSPGSSLSSSPSDSPVAMPSAPPSRPGDLHGPTTTRGLAMTIRGIGRLDDVEAWSAATAGYVMSYFNLTNDDPGAFDVTASIIVTNQKGSDDSLFERERGLVWGRRRLGGGGGRRAEADFEYVEVTYDQESMYRTPDPDEYDGEYVATTPFGTREGTEGYLATLRDLSPHFDDVESIGSPLVRYDEDGKDDKDDRGKDEVQNPPDDGKGKEKDNTRISIIIAVCAGVVILVVIVAVALRKRKKQEYLEPVGNGPPSSMRRIDDDLENGTDGTSVGVSSSTSARSRLISPSQPNSSSSVPENAAPNIIMLQVLVPAGKLGVVVDTPPTGGPAYICEIKDVSPILGQVRLEDKILAVDDVDVQRMSAVNVSRLLAKKSKQAQRRITVLREVGPDDGPAMTEATAMSAVYDSASSRILAMTSDAIQEREERRLDVVAPGGKLGLVLVAPESPAPPGPAYVFDVREDSPLFGRIRLRDKIIAVDDEDVQEMSAVDVSKLLGKKSQNTRRKITVLREVDDEDGGDEPNVVSSDSNDFSDSTESSAVETRIDIIAPRGKLGMVVDSPPGGGAAYVSNIREESPLRGQLRLGDRVIAIDDENVSKRKAMDISLMLARKSRQAERKITVLRSNAGGDDTSSDGNASSSTSLEGIKIDIIAPKGKLGVVVDSPPGGGAAYVSNIKDDSPICDQIRLGDKVVGVDDEDVSEMKAIQVSMILGSKSSNAARKITVLREDVDDEH